MLSNECGRTHSLLEASISDTIWGRGPITKLRQPGPEPSARPPPSRIKISEELARQAPETSFKTCANTFFFLPNTAPMQAKCCFCLCLRFCYQAQPGCCKTTLQHNTLDVTNFLWKGFPGSSVLRFCFFCLFVVFLWVFCQIALLPVTAPVHCQDLLLTTVLGSSKTVRNTVC